MEDKLGDEVAQAEDKNLLELRLLVGNYRIKAARVEKGLKMPEFAQACGMCKNTLYRICNLHLLPSEEQQEKIAVALGKPVDWLFPDSILKQETIKLFDHRKKLLDEPQVLMFSELSKLQKAKLLTDGSEYDEVVDHEVRTKVEEVLWGLQPRERDIIRARFGLDNGKEKTLEEIGQIQGCSRECVRQIEAKSLKKLKHPSRSRKLKGLL